MLRPKQEVCDKAGRKRSLPAADARQRLVQCAEGSHRRQSVRQSVRVNTGAKSCAVVTLCSARWGCQAHGGP